GGVRVGCRVRLAALLVSPVPAVFPSTTALAESAVTVMSKSPIPASPFGRVNVACRSAVLPGFSTPPEYATVVLSSVCPVRVLTTVTRSDHDPTAVAALPVFLSRQLIASEPPDCGDDGLTPSPITWRSAARTSTCWG